MAEKKRPPVNAAGPAPAPAARFVRACPVHGRALDPIELPGRQRDGVSRSNVEDVMVCRSPGAFHRVGELEWLVKDSFTGEVVHTPLKDDEA